MRHLIFFMLLISCQQNTGHKNDKATNLAMNRFALIDKKFEKTARQLGTKIDRSVGGSTVNDTPVPREKLACRKIIWIDGQIGKGIMLVQNFKDGNFDSPDWDFFILAWLNQRSPTEHGSPSWEKRLMEKVSLKTIEENIDSLINESLENLNALKKTDLH